MGGTEIEPGTQTHQITKLIDIHTKLKTEEATFKYSNLDGYHEEYDAKLTSQKYQVPIQINADTGAIELITGVNYKQITQQHFTEGTTGQMNRDFLYAAKGASVKTSHELKQWSRSTF